MGFVQGVHIFRSQMCDGNLLTQRLSSFHRPRQCNVVIVDEVHERDMLTAARPPSLGGWAL